MAWDGEKMIRSVELSLNRSAGGYRTLLSNGKNNYIVDTCVIHGLELVTMIFSCNENGIPVKWIDTECEDGCLAEEERGFHEFMVNQWIKKLEKDK